MPSTYKPNDEQRQPQYQNTQYQSTGQGSPQTRQQASTPYNGLLGVSQTTGQNLANLQTGYRQSDAVTNARNYLDSLESTRPGEYASRYTDQLDRIYDEIQNRGPFQYDLNGDQLWQQYKDQYMQSGKQAMLDTMGQAAALTGGYGNSYAASVGNQQYQQYLRDMTGIIPDLYAQAAARYDQGTQDAYNRYGLAQQADATDYQRYADQLAQWNADRNWGSQAYADEYARDYGQYGDMLNYWNNLAAQENGQYMTNRQYSYQLALQMLANGSMPTADLLAQAGISQADANSLLNPQVRTVVVNRGGKTGTIGDLAAGTALGGALSANTQNSNGTLETRGGTIVNADAVRRAMEEVKKNANQ